MVKSDSNPGGESVQELREQRARETDPAKQQDLDTRIAQAEAEAQAQGGTVQ